MLRGRKRNCARFALPWFGIALGAKAVLTASATLAFKAATLAASAALMVSLGVLAATAALAPSAALAADKLPVPVVTIYPGDIIREQMLTERDLPDFNGRNAVIGERSLLVGKIAKRTLLPNQPIAANAVAEPKIVTTGSMVRVIFQEGGLTITTYAAALQSGAVGDMVTVRNIESGLTVAGTIASDGSIHVGNS